MVTLPSNTWLCRSSRNWKGELEELWALPGRGKERRRSIGGGRRRGGLEVLRLGSSSLLMPRRMVRFRFAWPRPIICLMIWDLTLFALCTLLLTPCAAKFNSESWSLIYPLYGYWLSEWRTRPEKDWFLFVPHIWLEVILFLYEGFAGLSSCDGELREWVSDTTDPKWSKKHVIQCRNHWLIVSNLVYWSLHYCRRLTRVNIFYAT